MMAKAASKSETELKPHYSVLIIGAGINGAGLFRDLCLQGVDCLLIDRGDICEGASAAPSRLIHGGIKYLETGEFRLVKESAMERNRLLRNAPHFVKPLETVVPVRSWLGGIMPSALRFLGFNTKLADRGAVITEIGLRIYDAFSRKVQALPDHRFFGPKRLRGEYPGFTKDIVAAGLYYEGRITHAERLGLELVMDGLAANIKSALRTYTTATRGTKPNEFVLADSITLESASITADVIINAGGAWIDKVNAALGIASSHIGGSKGSHLIVDHPELVAALKGRMIYFGTADGRVNLVYPFFGHVLIGATDIAVNDPDEASCSPEETQYLINVIREIMPEIQISPKQILLSYCGVRPLPRSTGKDIGTVSRDHAIARDQLPGTNIPVLSLIGGKWTTFRAFAAQSADVVLQQLGKARLCNTDDLAIGGGKSYPRDPVGRDEFIAKIATSFSLSVERARTLFDRYGTTASTVAASLVTGNDRLLASLPAYTIGEAVFICRTEHVRRLSDLLLRRTAIAMEGGLSIALVQEVAQIAGKILGWSKSRTEAEITLAIAEMKKRAVHEITGAKLNPKYKQETESHAD